MDSISFPRNTFLKFSCFLLKLDLVFVRLVQRYLRTCLYLCLGICYNSFFCIHILFFLGFLPHFVVACPSVISWKRVKLQIHFWGIACLKIWSFSKIYNILAGYRIPGVKMLFYFLLVSRAAVEAFNVIQILYTIYRIFLSLLWKLLGAFLYSLCSEIFSNMFLILAFFFFAFTALDYLWLLFCCFFYSLSL